jgi:transposase
LKAVRKQSAGAPDESGQRRREKEVARAGNARVRHGMISVGLGFLRRQPESMLAQWFRQRTQDGRRTTRKTMIMAFARKLLIALWRLATTGEVPPGRSAAPGNMRRTTGQENKI